MCGISGYFKVKCVNFNEPNTIIKMMEAIKHRGIDGSDYFINQSVALGFNRLSIVGVDNGMQPVSNETGDIVLICNGEIYNYKELKKELQARGHRFRTESDVEVILHLYEEYGYDLLDRISGQFAFVIYDEKQESLFCARDHIGVAPFFFSTVDSTFVFASEIKSILQYPGVKREVDLVALDQIMTFPGVICPRTFFKGISSLEAGHFLTVDRNGTITDRRYWDIDYPKKDSVEYPYSEEEYVEKLDYLLEEAVRKRLQADVPVGFYISGGLDSSIIACKIYSNCTEKRHSFAVNFEGDKRPERPFQELMAGHVGSIHHARDIAMADIASYLPKAVYHSEGALKETYNTASLILSEMAHKEGIKVVLTGEGADELFAGYVGYQFDVMRANSKAAGDPGEEAVRQKIWGDRSFFYEKDYDRLREYKKGFYTAKVTESGAYDCLKQRVIDIDQISNVDIVHKRSYIDLKLRLSEHLLAGHGDRAGLANSVEARYPFLDKELMEFARQIPPDLKLHRLKEKYILKRLAAKSVPERIISRPKYAFVAPGSPEIMKQNLEYVNDILSYETVRRQGYFNPDEVEKLKREYLKDGFRLNLPYDNDWLIIVLTFGLLLEEFKLPSL